jgi:hypothetical protein
MTTTGSNPQYCYRHPSVETSLRCNRCERPICSRCAIHTETGYRCRECIRGQQKVFDTATWYDFPVAIGLAILLSTIGGLVSNLLVFFVVFLAPLAGIAIAEVVRIVIHHRRNRSLFKLVGVAVFLGGLLPVIPSLWRAISVISGGVSSLALVGTSLLSLLWPILYAIFAASSCYYRLAGIQLR